MRSAQVLQRVLEFLNRAHIRCRQLASVALRGQDLQPFLQLDLPILDRTQGLAQTCQVPPRNRHIALPLGIARVAGRQTLGNVETGLITLERGGGVALGGLRAADIAVADREVALPPGVARVAGGQALVDG